jgi:hypothetical protein
MITEDGGKSVQGYSPFTAEEYRIKSVPRLNTPAKKVDEKTSEKDKID